MIYRVVFSLRAEEDVIRLKRNEPQANNKFLTFINELREHPRTGTGRVELMCEDKSGQYSRRITLKHRLVYMIYEDILTVLVLSAYDH
jgi:toxin YoeB